jgi:hypothetical protein
MNRKLVLAEKRRKGVYDICPFQIQKKNLIWKKTDGKIVLDGVDEKLNCK